MRNDVNVEGIRRQGIRLLLASATAAIGVLGVAGSAGAVTIAAAEDCCEFTGEPFIQDAGITAQLSNPGSPNRAAHNVYSEATGPDGGPLFFSTLVQPGQTRPVRGTEYLAVGVYDFVCTLHRGMTGILEVAGGQPVARPRVFPAVPAQALSTVRKRGRLAVTVRSPGGAGPVSLLARSAGRVIGSARTAALAAGQSRTVSVTLSPRGKRLIAKGKSVRIDVRAVAEFGIPATATRVLRLGAGR